MSEQEPTVPAAKFEEFLKRWDVTLSPLYEDMVALRPTPGSTEQRPRRVYVRAVFAWIECQLDMYASYLMLSPQTRLTAEESMLLRDEEAFIDQNGRAQIRPRTQTFLARVRFVLELLRKYNTRSVVPSFSDVGWRSLQNSVKVRDRLTHPKLARELDVSDDEIKELLQARDWVMSIELAGRQENT